MQSLIKFFHHDTGLPSDCGQVLKIELSSRNLGWKGIILEKGNSPHFHPNHVSTPYFYFALGLEEDLHWEAETDGGMSPLITAPGDIWINPPNTPFTHRIDEPCYFVIVAVEESTFLGGCPLTTEGRRISFLNNYNVHDDALKGIIELFRMEVEAGGRNGPEYVSNLISMLSVHYLNNYSNYPDLENSREQHSRLGDHELYIVRKLIDDRMDEPITVDEMAETLHCSKFYFLREFKKLTGVTPYQYLLNRKLEHARNLLLSGNGNILTVALESGFSDQSHFTRAFKKRFGMTPGKFRST